VYRYNKMHLTMPCRKLCADMTRQSTVIMVTLVAPTKCDSMDSENVAPACWVFRAPVTREKFHHIQLMRWNFAAVYFILTPPHRLAVQHASLNLGGELIADVFSTARIGAIPTPGGATKTLGQPERLDFVGSKFCFRYIVICRSNAGQAMRPAILEPDYTLHLMANCLDINFPHRWHHAA